METVEIYKASGKNVRITLENGKVFEGVVEGYSSAEDNEDAAFKPGVASIEIGFYGFYEDEITSIEVLPDAG